MNEMTYKGYTAKVEYDDSIDAFYGSVLHMRDGITFEADTVAGLHKEFKESVEDYLEYCKQRGEEPEKPYSGNIVVRMDPDLHRDLASLAARTETSINSILEQGARHMLARSKTKRKPATKSKRKPKSAAAKRTSRRSA